MNIITTYTSAYTRKTNYTHPRPARVLSRSTKSFLSLSLKSPCDNHCPIWRLHASPTATNSRFPRSSCINTCATPKAAVQAFGYRPHRHGRLVLAHIRTEKWRLTHLRLICFLPRAASFSFRQRRATRFRFFARRAPYGLRRMIYEPARAPPLR